MSKNKIIIIALIALLLVAAVLIFARGQEDTWICKNGLWVKHGQPGASMPTEPCGELKSTDKNTISDFASCAAAGYPIMESYPRQCRAENGEIFTEAIAPENGNTDDKSELIRVDSPSPGELIQGPFTVRGQARGYWFFEASFPVKLYDGNGQLLATAIAQAQGDWMTEDFVPFEARFDFNAPLTAEGVLVLEKDNPSGLPANADEIRIPVNLKAIGEIITVKAFFMNNELDPDISCNLVFLVERKIAKTMAPARAALDELLRGPTETEKTEGFSTSINTGVKIQSLEIVRGVASVDFDDQLEFQMGGSCRVAAIRAQITETLKQFPMVEEVIISVNGRTEDILQP